MNPKSLFEAIGSAKSVKLGLASNPESSSDWVKTVIDPAHAREYGCRGIPDENQQPTLVLNGRVTITINYSAFFGGDVVKYVWDVDAQNWVQAVPNAEVTDLSIQEITVLQGEIARHTFVVAHGFANVASYTGAEVYLIKWYRDAVIPGDQPARLVAQSYTMDWIGREIDRSGYIEAGYTWTHEVKPTVATTSDTTYQHSTDLVNLTNLVTYTGSYEQGCYIVSQFNNYDAYRWWKGRLVGNHYFGLPNRTEAGGDPMAVAGVYGSGITEYWTPSHLGSSRKCFIRYLPLPNNSGGYENTWTFRLTVNQVVEVMAPYSAGGSDAAVYDAASVQDMIALYDNFDLIFPASYNDFKKVWNWIKSHAPKALGFATSVMRHFPQTANLSAALDALVGNVTLSQALHDVQSPVVAQNRMQYQLRNVANRSHLARARANKRRQAAKTQTNLTLKA